VPVSAPPHLIKDHHLLEKKLLYLRVFGMRFYYNSVPEELGNPYWVNTRVTLALTWTNPWK